MLINAMHEIFLTSLREFKPLKTIPKFPLCRIYHRFALIVPIEGSKFGQNTVSYIG